MYRQGDHPLSNVLESDRGAAQVQVNEADL
jgi:hypothetical protein